MKHFQLYNDRVEIFLADGNKLIIYFTDQTGQIFFRYKINTISWVRHPGIVVGLDNSGRR